MILVAIVFGFLLAFIIKRVFFTDKRVLVPGMQPKSKEKGNLEDLAAAGGIQPFLEMLHQKYGDIASFWFGPQLTVSIASPELFKEQQNTFDRPFALFKIVEPLIGPRSLQFANKEDGKGRRKEYDRSMSHSAVARYMTELKEVSEETVAVFHEALKEGVTAHPACTQMATFSMKAGLLALFGDVSEESKILDYNDNYEICWSDLEARLDGTIPKEGSERDLKFKEAFDKLNRFVKEIVKRRQNMEITEENERFIDILIRYCPDEETLLSDAMTYVVGGLYNTANALAWCMYHLGDNGDVQEKLYKEIEEKIGNNEITFSNINSCKYLKQILDEILRLAILAPFAARYMEEDIKLGGYDIPAGTPILHALGVSLQNPVYFPEPTKFDPERFSPENVKTRPAFAYKPFGLGKRKCPGYNLAILAAAVCVVTVIKEFKIGLVEGQDIKLIHGLISHPSEEIMITLTPHD